METILRCVILFIFIKFKSYYVVWKPDIPDKKLAIALQFKSYYVVWKLKYIYDKEKKKNTFKSYYVVWKPDIRNVVSSLR